MVYRSFAIASKVERDWWLLRSLFHLRQPRAALVLLRATLRSRRLRFPGEPLSPRLSSCTSIFCRPPTPRQREPSLGEINCVSVYLSLCTPPPPCASSLLAQDSCEYTRCYSPVRAYGCWIRICTTMHVRRSLRQRATMNVLLRE